MKNILFELFQIIKIFKSYLGNKIYLTFVLFVIAGLLESFGIVMLIPLFEGLDNSSEINNLNNNLPSIVVGKLYGYFGLEKSLISTLLFILIIFLTKGIISFIALGYSSILKGRFLKILKEKIYTKLSAIDYK